MDDLALAADLVRAAGTLAARMLREGLDVEHKTSVSDVVSAADRAAEEFVVRELRRHRPDDGIVGEEGTDHAGPSGRTWYIDPVDGTYNFLSGIPVWCSALALDETLGAVYQPSTDELWTGGPGLATTRNDIALPPLADQPLARVSVASYVHPPRMSDATLREPWLRVIAGAATVRMLGTGSVELAAVAGGRLGAFVQADSLPWDWWPGVALVRGTGGVAEVIETPGHRWHVAGNRQTVAEIIALLTG